jgi:hypothetical protein
MTRAERERLRARIDEARRARLVSRGGMATSGRSLAERCIKATDGDPHLALLAAVEAVRRSPA